jgi:biotin carboxyl carrier protein
MTSLISFRSRKLVSLILTRFIPNRSAHADLRSPFRGDYLVVKTRMLVTNIPKGINEKEEEPEIEIHVKEQEKKVIKEETINLDDYNIEIKVEMPDLGESKGMILRWYKKEGDIIHHDETICDIETEMFTFGMDVEDENEGIMKEILVKEGGDYVKPGTPICTILHKPM